MERLRSGTRGPRGLPETTAGSAVPVIGYASSSRPPATARHQLKLQSDLIARECERRGLVLVEMVREREPENGKRFARPGLAYALERISHGEAAGLIVDELARVTHSAAELGIVIRRLYAAGAHLVAVSEALDTRYPEGRLAADVLLEVSSWERERLSERTRHGLEIARRKGRATGRPSVSDYPELGMRIAKMRADGMTLQGIADQLNAEGVPTIRGGAKWRHSSVQAAAGYKRPGSARGMSLDGRI